MEYFWYFLASLGAGIGTGLAGLSAATVMVPMLIVLCPSFAGESGAYHATAIALASDILGSAVTSWVYYKHKNIDLKRGGLMMVCILLMCIAGSYVAYSAGSVVLGNFSLFLTLAIGIRFLVKPDTQRKDTAAKGSKLGIKEIIISLFFGLTIGFGAGFVGTGGGMMMLVVFTVFLGMELKTAVGTSTFIMTFTALIASVSHVAIDMTILLERIDALVICIVTATIASLVSARFANKVSNRTVGLSTGIVLTLLGTSMIILKYWDVFTTYALFNQVLSCCKGFLTYILLGAFVLIVSNFLFKIPRFIFRKLLHIVAFTSVIVMVLYADNGWAAAITSLLFAIVVYPILLLFESNPLYDQVLVQKKKGEIKLSLLILFVSMAVIIAITWGIFDKQYITIATLLIWGMGDAMAALVGIPYGKHVIKWKYADGKKSWEGSIAMFFTAWFFGFISLYHLSPYSLIISIIYACIAAVVASIVELVSRNGNDTCNVPGAVSLLLLVLSMF
ncbi:MAG: TSUP family transporter [Erysipelotrichales bacterium]|nr:TSUP family transporter [Erysipelotrichales bacterium]